MRRSWIISLLLIFLIAPQAHAWYYHMQINVTDTSGTNLTNYPVSFYMNTSQYIQKGLLRSDCADFNFTINGTEVPYIVEDCNTTHSRIWFLVPNLPANSTVTVDVYFGDPTVYNVHSPSEIFPYYNNFESPDSVANLTGLEYVTNITYDGHGAALKNSSGLVCTPNDTFNLSQNFIVEAYIYAPNNGVGDEMLIMNDSLFGYSSGVTHDSDAFFANRYFPYPSYSGSSVVMSADPIAAWTRRVMIFRAGTVYTAIYDLNGTLLASSTFADNAYKPYTKICFSNFGSYTDYHYYIDHIIIRPYASSDPSVSVSQPEQLFLPQYINKCGDIMFSGEYFLNTSLYFGDAVNASSPFDFQSCIRILADNVTLNCMGHSILGNSNILYNKNATYKPTVAINVIGDKNIKIVNCNIFNTTYPIRSVNSTVTLSNLKTDAGVYARNSTLTVTDSTFYGIPFSFMKNELQACGYSSLYPYILTNVWNPASGGFTFPKCGRYWVLDNTLSSSSYVQYPIPPAIGSIGSKVYISRSTFENNAPAIVSSALYKIIAADVLSTVLTSDLSVLGSVIEADYLTGDAGSNAFTGIPDDGIISEDPNVNTNVYDSQIKYKGGYYSSNIPYLPKQIAPSAQYMGIPALALSGGGTVGKSTFYGVTSILSSSIASGVSAEVSENTYDLFPYLGIYAPYQGNYSTSQIYHNYYGLYKCSDFLQDNGGSLSCPPNYIFGNDANISNSDYIPYNESPSDICIDANQDGICDKPFVFKVTTSPLFKSDAIDTAPYSYYHLHPVLDIGTGGVAFMQMPMNVTEEIKQKIMIIPHYLRVYVPPNSDSGSLQFEVINNGQEPLYFYFGATKSIEQYIRAPKLGTYFYIAPNSGQKFELIIHNYNKTQETYGSLILYADFPQQLVKIPVRVEITRKKPQEGIAWVLIPIILILLLIAI